MPPHLSGNSAFVLTARILLGKILGTGVFEYLFAAIVTVMSNLNKLCV